MNEFFAYVLIGCAGWLGWLIWSNKTKFALLLECGMGVMSLGLVTTADCLLSHDMSRAGLYIQGAGLLIMCASIIKQGRKRKREIITSEPRMINGSDLRLPSGGGKK